MERRSPPDKRDHAQNGILNVVSVFNQLAIGIVNGDLELREVETVVSLCLDPKRGENQKYN